MKLKKQAEREPRRSIVQHADGYYWQSSDGKEEGGPFATLAEAEEDLLAGAAGFEPADTLQEAETEVGVAEWIDPDSGMPAEDSIPRLEDH